MKASIIVSVLLFTVLISSVSSTILDGFRISGNPADSNLVLPIASATYFNGSAYIADKVVNAATISGRVDNQLLFRQRDLHIALTTKTDTATGGVLSMTFPSFGNYFELDLLTPADAGGVFTIVYDAVETSGSESATLPPACTSTFGNPVLLDSPNCADTNQGGITLLPTTQAIDLTRGGTNFAFVLPVDSVTPASASFPVIIRVWSENATSSLRLNSSDISEGQLTFEYSRFSGRVNFRQALALAIQFELAPGSNLTFSAFQAVGVSLVKNMILFDTNGDTIANPGETVQMNIVISKPYLPANLGNWNFQWIDTLSPLVSLQPTSITYSSQLNDGSVGVPAAGVNQVSFQLVAPAGTQANIYTVSFLTTVNPVNTTTVQSLSNSVPLNFTLSNDPSNYTITANAPQIRVGGAPNLSLAKTCPGTLAAGQQGTIFYTVMNNGSVNANQVTIIQTFTPPARVISRYDDQWNCTTNTTQVSCTYTFPNSLGYAGNFNGQSNEVSVNFTFTVSEALDCSLNNLGVTSSVESISSTGTSYTFPDSMTTCNIALVPTVNLSIEATVVNNQQTITVGGNAFYNVYYTNNGNSPAYDLLIYDTIPADTYAIIPPNYNWICDNSSNICVYRDTMGPLQPGQTRMLLIGLTIGPAFRGAFACNQWSVTSSSSSSQFCTAEADSNQICLPVVNAATNATATATPTPTPASPSVCPSVSPSPCVYCLAGSTINISLKSLYPSGSCSNGNCNKR